MEIRPSTGSVSPGKLAIKLLVAMLCSQFLITAITFFGGSVIANFWNVGPYDTTRSNFLGIAALFFIIAGPLLLGMYLMPVWRGLFSGFLGLITMIGCAIIYYLVDILTPIKSHTVLSLFFGLIPSLGMGVILAGNEKMKSRQAVMGAGLGIFIGLGMSVILGIVIGLGRVSAYSILSLPFLWIWLSAIFFPDLLAHRTDWRGVLIWLVLMIVVPVAVFHIIPSIMPGA